MAWIEIHQELPEHPKTDALMDAIGCERPTAVGHVIMSLLWALRYAHDGVIIPKRLGAIARGAGWNSEPLAFASAMVEAGWWDVIAEGWKLHDWDVYAGMLIAKREKDAARKRGDRGGDHPKPVHRTSDGRPSDGSMDGAGTNSTNQHDQHVHVSTDVDEPAKVASLTFGPPAPDDDALEDVIPVAKAEGVTQAAGRSAPKPDDSYSPEFKVFWAPYPRKVVKDAAAESYKRARSKGATAEEIQAGLVRWLGSVDWADQDLKHLPHASTWLNQRRWKDEPEQATKNGAIPMAADGRPDDLAWERSFVKAYDTDAERIEALVDRARAVQRVALDKVEAQDVLDACGLDGAMRWVRDAVKAGVNVRAGVTHG